MANYGWNNFVFEIDPTDGGALANLSSSLIAIGIGDKEYATEEITPAGQTWFQALQTGIRMLQPVQCTFLYDDAASPATKPVFITSAHAQTRTVKLTYGGTSSTTFEAWIQKTKITPAAKEITKLVVDLLPTGTITEA